MCVHCLTDTGALECITEGQREAHDAEEPPKGGFGKPALEPGAEVATADPADTHAQPERPLRRDRVVLP